MTGEGRVIEIALRVEGRRQQLRDSGFDEPVEYARFAADGREPARRLKREVAPGTRVLSESSVGSGELIEL
ncbi:hypothetical protein AB8O38_13435 [Saccharomonospora xinjiangensis]|uniref:hypothetical protein n=1 Tax=Saccharomonospora xinjiangensis TaxID=75294 RepID=UPI00350F0302